MIGLEDWRDSCDSCGGMGVGNKTCECEWSSGSGPTAVSPLVYHWIFLGLVSMPLK